MNYNKTRPYNHPFINYRIGKTASLRHATLIYNTYSTEDPHYNNDNIYLLYRYNNILCIINTVAWRF